MGKLTGPLPATGRGKTINETGAGLGGSAVGILSKDITIGVKLSGKNCQRKTIGDKLSGGNYQ